ncbi:hypothetical protein DICA3_D05622 [Diutina catenulata]
MPIKRKASQQALGESKHHKDDSLKPRLLEILKELDTLEDPETHDGYTQPFLKLVSKKQYPDYYEVISEPISLNEIAKKVKNGHYVSKDAFVADFDLMLANARLYNDDSSWIVAAARAIADYVHEHTKTKLKLKLKAEKPEDEITFGKLPQICNAVLDDVISHEFGEDGVLSGPFMDDVDTSVYTDYSKFVTHPTSFNTIKFKLENRKFFSPKFTIVENLERFGREAKTIFTNAQAYNDPGSMIYEDAERMSAYFTQEFEKIVTRAQRQLEAKEKQRMKEQKEAEEREAAALAAAMAPPPPIEIVVDKSQANTLGKTAGTMPRANCVIQGCSLASATSVALNVASAKPHFVANPARYLFPTHKFGVTSLFEYKFSPTGYANQAFSISIPPGSKPSCTVHVSLHEQLYRLKKADLESGTGFMNSTSDEDFQCTLKVNEDEVPNSDASCFNSLLGLSYSFKLNHGLNVLDFEIKTAPHVARKIKEFEGDNEEESGGRHTRHQFQQMKMSWDVERFTMYVNYNGL